MGQILFMIVFPVDGRRGRHFPEGIEKTDRTALWFDVPFASSRALDEIGRGRLAIGFSREF